MKKTSSTKPQKKTCRRAPVVDPRIAVAEELQHAALEIRRYFRLARSAALDVEENGPTPEAIWRLRSALRLADVFSEIVVRDQSESLDAASRGAA